MTEQAAIGQPTYTVEQLDTPAGPRWFVVNESAPGNTRKYLASYATEAEAIEDAQARNGPRELAAVSVAPFADRAESSARDRWLDKWRRS